MESTYHSGQLVIINKIEKDYKTGDVVLFYCEGLEASLVKRIVACPGDTVCIKDGTLIISGTVVVGCGQIECSDIAHQELVVPAGYFFLLGDNLDKSINSRYDAVGLVSVTDIEGIVM